MEVPAPAPCGPVEPGARPARDTRIRAFSLLHLVLGALPGEAADRRSNGLSHPSSVRAIRVASRRDSVTDQPQPHDTHYRKPGWFTRNVSNGVVALLTRLGLSVWGS